MNQDKLLTWAEELRDIDESQFDIRHGVTGDFRTFPSPDMTGGPMEWLPIFFPEEWEFNKMGFPRLKPAKVRTFSHWDVASWAKIRVSDVYKICMPDAYKALRVTPSMVADRITLVVSKGGNQTEIRKAA